ncbi:MAG TPA: NAD(P)-dependent oxidoreductase [Lacunisphaera sp.]|nr:NAD(P)-dependent oxidoreductase [Lacunisphaera sp.]
MSLTVWTNHELRPEAGAYFNAGLAQAGCRLLQSALSSPSVLVASGTDAALADAEIAYGQPDPADVMKYPRLKWVSLSSAGYTRYDRDDFRAAMRARGTLVTNASEVFADPCAQQMLAAMLALVRGLPTQLRNQDGPRAWRYFEDRYTNRVLTDANVVLLGYGAIGRRLAQLLAPFGARVAAFRRSARGDEGVPVVTEAGLAAALGAADHVVNLLPEAAGTRNFVAAARFAQMKPGARFYNIGRGTTVDQPALIAALEAGHVSGAYLDVMEPEPLPPEHPLWRAPNCYITCHIGGGTGDQDFKLARHFLDNLRRFQAGEPLVDRII